jgi:transposase InsO family protein
MEAESKRTAINTLQQALPFALPSPSQTPHDAPVAAIPEAERVYTDLWMSILVDNLNGTWRLHRGQTYGGRTIRNGDDFIKARAQIEKLSARAIYAKLKTAREILRDPEVPKNRKWAAIAEAVRPKPRPGRSSAAFFAQPENAWMWPELRRIYLNQARFSKEQTYRLLIDLIERKREGHKPSKWQVFAALKKISKPELVLGREGAKAFDDQCGAYISRNPDTLRANDLWVTDQREVDVRLRDGGEHLGRIWMVSYLDVATDRILGYSFAPIFSSDTVMMAAVMAIERFGVPRAIALDLGKEFCPRAFNGSTRKFSGGVLYRDAQGLWNSLGVRIVKAIARNPKSKTIERFHREVTEKLDKRFPGYCGSNTDERPEKLADEEAQHLAWLAGHAARTPLVTIGQYIRAFIAWAEQDWNGCARGRGKMRRGMSPKEAWQVKQPAQGLRTITLDQLDHATADHRFVKVARGGQVNLTFFGQTLEYEAPELFHHQGEDCEVIVSRRTFHQVTVLYLIAGGIGSCVATLKPQLAWLPENRDELRAAMRCKGAIHRAVRQGLKASRVALEAANPVDLLERQRMLPAKQIIGTQKFFGPTPDHPSIGSPEYMMRMRGHRQEDTEPQAEPEAPGKSRGLNFSDVVE